MKKFLIFICCIASLGTLAGCSNDSDDIKTDTNIKVDVGNIDAKVKVDAGNIDDSVKVDVGNIKTDIDVK
ncbi:MAG: hypothetical protein ACI4I9_04950 [Porcipelethomonas sp.]|jgi:hypothetical protein